MSKPAPNPLFKLATELGPLLIFFLANAKFGLFVATAVFMAAVVVAIAASYAVTRHVPMMALVTALVVMVFGALTLYLHDETFIKMKPTIIYALFALVLGGGLIVGRSFIAVLFDQMFNLTEAGWRKLTLRWALFFVAMALLNEVVWRTQSTDFWVAFKLFGFVPLTMIFAIAQMPLINRETHGAQKNGDAARGDATGP
jgi:intracellular septation protein